MKDFYSIDMRKIVEQFGTVIANDSVDFRAKPGEIHALLGENGAGKSTIMCMLSGVYRPTSGDIYIKGEKARIRSPKDAMKLGIGMVFQNFRLVQTLTAAENIVLWGRSSFWRGPKWMKNKQEEIEAIADRFGLSIPVNRPIWQLSVGEQQRVEIVKTLYRGADFIILDEPTSVLTPIEADQLFITLKRMKAEGKTVIMTTHKLKEVMAASDRISVMRKGKMIYTSLTSQTNERELARLMVGKEMNLEERNSSISSPKGKRLLSVDKVDVHADHGRKALHALCLDVYEGEIVGIAGVAGNGQKELAEVLTGLRPKSGGTIIFDGKEMKTASVREAIEAGIAHVPENRMRSGLAGTWALSIICFLNLTGLASVQGLAFFVPVHKEWSQSLIDQFDVKTADLLAPVSQMSGGISRSCFLPGKSIRSRGLWWPFIQRRDLMWVRPKGFTDY